MRKGVVVSIHISPEATQSMLSVNEARAVPGKGLEGDRYFKQVGTYSNKPAPGGLPPARELTLIEIETIEALKRESGIEIAAGDVRRNIVTRDVPLNHFMNREFRVGEIKLRGIRLCEPCDHVQRLTGKEILQPLVHRGGIRAEILTDGVIRVGDTIEQ